METLLWVLVLLISFSIMEFMAWFSHKYNARFSLGTSQRYHKKNHKSWFERNDLFFIFYAIVSAVFVLLWGEYNFWPGYQLELEFFAMV